MSAEVLARSGDRVLGLDTAEEGRYYDLPLCVIDAVFSVGMSSRHGDAAQGEDAASVPLAATP